MKSKPARIVIAVFALAYLALPASAGFQSGTANGQLTQVVNIDFDPDSSTPANAHSGADGVLGTVGTEWNVIPAFPGVTSGLQDEFGGPTTVGIDVQEAPLTYFGATQNNNLQDSGLSAGYGQAFRSGPGGNGSPSNDIVIVILNLIESELYSLAFYVAEARDSKMIQVTHAGGIATGSQTATPSTYALPGLANQDYILFPGLNPVQVAANVFGFSVVIPMPYKVADSRIGGLQVSGPFLIPEPSTLVLILSSIGVVAARRMRRSPVA